MSQKTYRIGEAAAKLNLKDYVLRFWETEFPQIAPLRTDKGQRLYTESDLAVLGRIRYLLHERGLTIDGARRLLREEATRGALRTDADILSSDMAGEDAAGGPGDETAPAGSAGGAGCPADDGRASPGTAVHALQGPAQASLFPTETADAMNQTELRGIVAELEAIHRLLAHDGETP